MTAMDERIENLVFQVPLPGGQERLRQMILYVCEKCVQAELFGQVKLNKILWRADFHSYAKRMRPVTGRAYQRLPFGPALKEMLPLLREMQMRDEIEISEHDFGEGIIERRPKAKIPAKLNYFSSEDVVFVNDSIRHYWNMSGRESSDESHGVAWSTRSDKEPMPYNSAFLSDATLTPSQWKRLVDLGHAQFWRSA